MPKNLETPAQREAQKKAFIEAARAAGCSEDEAEFDANLKRIASAKVIAPNVVLDAPKDR
jgi:uncharacterized protein HemY